VSRAVARMERMHNPGHRLGRLIERQLMAGDCRRRPTAHDAANLDGCYRRSRTSGPPARRDPLLSVINFTRTTAEQRFPVFRGCNLNSRSLPHSGHPGAGDISTPTTGLKVLLT